MAARPPRGLGVAGGSQAYPSPAGKAGLNPSPFLVRGKPPLPATTPTGYVDQALGELGPVGIAAVPRRHGAPTVAARARPKRDKEDERAGDGKERQEAQERRPWKPTLAMIFRAIHWLSEEVYPPRLHLDARSKNPIQGEARLERLAST